MGGYEHSQADDVMLRYRFAHVYTSGAIDVCADDAGANRQPGCVAFFSPSRPATVADLTGQHLWVHPPHHDPSPFIDLFLETHRASADTTGFLCVPHRPAAGWYYAHVLRPRAPLSVVKVLQQADQVFYTRPTATGRRHAGPSREPPVILAFARRPTDSNGTQPCHGPGG